MGEAVDNTTTKIATWSTLQAHSFLPRASHLKARVHSHLLFMLPFDFWVVSKEKTQPRDAEQTTDSKEDKTEVVSRHSYS